jgi:flagellar biogenesis protein FliO
MGAFQVVILIWSSKPLNLVKGRLDAGIQLIATTNTRLVASRRRGYVIDVRNYVVASTAAHVSAAQWRGGRIVEERI